jgi:selenocysteine lyase/cysteine desulfurase
MLSCQRDLFSLPEGLHYLNSAARTPLLKSSEAIGMEALQRQRVPGELTGEAYQRASEALRAGIGRLINAPADAIALVPAVSYGVAIAAHHVRLRRGQNVVLPSEDFPSDVYPWMTACAAAGAEVRLVERPPPGPAPARAWSERVLEALDGNTAVVNLSAVHWTDGTLFDLAAIGRRAREVGALFVVDGSQLVGAAPFDFAAVQPDLLVGVGYKWLLGPYQLGYAAVGERLRDAVPFEQHWGNRLADASGGSTAYSTEYRPGARRFDGGEHANPITLPMFCEGVRQVLAWGVDAVQAYCAALGRRLQPLAADGRLQMAEPGQRCEHIIGLRPADAAAMPRILECLRRRNVRVSQRGSAVRVAPYVFNTPADLDALCEALEEALR